MNVAVDGADDERRFGAEGGLGSRLLRSWIDLLKPAVERTAHSPDETARHVALERETVRLSMERLMDYPFVAERVRTGALEINGARFGIADGKLEIFDRAVAAFRAI